MLPGQVSIVLVAWPEGPFLRGRKKTDEQVANELEDNAVLLGQITLEQWRDVLKVDGRATVLEIAARSGWEAVTRYLDVIKDAHKGLSWSWTSWLSYGPC